MSDAAVARHKAILIKNLKRIYHTGTITRPGAKVSNGRGGFTSTPAQPEPVWLQRETEARILAPYNLKPDQALIFVLNTIDAPVEGNKLENSVIGSFIVKDVTLDPVTAVYHCRCDCG